MGHDYDIKCLEEKIQENQDLLEEIFYQLGQDFYEKQQFCPPEEFEEIFERITQMKKETQQMSIDRKLLMGLIECPECHWDNQEDSIFCGNCGQRLQKDPRPEGSFLCTRCKGVILAGYGYCGYCGTPVTETKENSLKEELSE